MKNRIVFFAGLGLSVMAHAQSSVTLYGTIDNGFQFTSNQKGDRSYILQQGGARQQ
ncbi:hypothetical protein [Burkholderia cenocepacia]|uniref:hypothetical protein n=1 Tax=Burkholderia cenocepacia TaxID=95486 RepID=UPI001FC850BA|nr:hypothetical protein [Burkholderia cenocepacia]